MPGLTVAELYPIRDTRFVGGRTYHHVKRPASWADELEAACGKRGHLASGYTTTAVGQCPGCQAALADPNLDATEAAARKLLARKVAEKLISRRTADELMRTALPMVRTTLVDLVRIQGKSPEWVTEAFQAKRAKAEAARAAAKGAFQRVKTAGELAAAELYLAVWAGLQEDLGRYLADQRAEQPADRPALGG